LNFIEEQNDKFVIGKLIVIASEENPNGKNKGELIR